MVPLRDPGSPGGSCANSVGWLRDPECGKNLRVSIDLRSLAATKMPSCIRAFLDLDWGSSTFTACGDRIMALRETLDVFLLL